MRALVPLVLAAAVAAVAAPLDARQGEIVFTSRQMGVPVDGRFRRFEGEASLDLQRPEGARVAVSVDLASVEIGTAEIEAELARPEWFATQAHPRATFRSTAVKALGGGRFEVTGALTLKGRTREVVVPVALASAGGVVTAAGAFIIQRSAFGIGQGEWSDTALVADDVRVRFTLRLP